MPTRDAQIVVIGSGPNGLVAAAKLATLGLRVLVLDAHPRRPGGAVRSEELTLPGFLHDVGAAHFPLAAASPAFAELDLAALGVEWLKAEVESCHLGANDGHACLTRADAPGSWPLGADADLATWRHLADSYLRIEQPFIELALSPAPPWDALQRVGLLRSVQLWHLAQSRSSSLSRRWLRSEAARGILPSLAAYLNVAPNEAWSGGAAYLFAMTALTTGLLVPRGGAQSITNALVTLIERHGGRIRLGSRVVRLLVRQGHALGVELQDGSEVAATRGVLVATTASSLFQDLCERKLLPARYLRRLHPETRSVGLYKVDWALAGTVPWRIAAARHSAMVFTNSSREAIVRATRQARSGRLPESPCLVLSQASVADPGRAPHSRHTLSGSLRVPLWDAGQWEQLREALADRTEEHIETLAPGFRRLVLARSVATPSDQHRLGDAVVGHLDATLVHNWRRRLPSRWLAPHSEYRTPIRGLYVGSSATHPGPGVHGMCGYNAARTMVRDLT